MNNPGTVLLTVSDMSIVEGEMEIDETDIPHVKVGPEGEAHVRRLSRQEVRRRRHGDRRQPDHEVRARHGLVRRELQGEGRRSRTRPSNIRPGFSVSGKIETDRRASALAIPIPALVVADPASLERPKGKKPTPVPTPTTAAAEKKKDVEGVFIVKKEGAVDFRPVKTGINADLQTEVLEGLADGEEIVTGPFKALRSLKIGDRVKVDNSAAGPDAAKKS